MRWSRAWVLAMATGALVACESATEPPVAEGPALEPDGARIVATSAAGEGVIARATGSAQREAAGGPVILNFSAVKRADGTVTGEYTYRALAVDQWLRVKVTCMTVVDGNKAWIGGITVAAFLPQLVGRVSYFYTFDNGEGADAAPDVVSLVRANDVAGADQEFCTELPTVLPAIETLRGNVNVTG